MRFCRLLSLALLATTAIPSLAIGALPPHGFREHLSLAAREQQLWASATHNSEFGSVLHATAPANCEMTQPPQALATPNPVLDRFQSSAIITVTFIIGTDGLVHSPLILQGAGPAEDRAVLHTIRSWRYRPATCNGVPTESEGKILFSSR
jgi:Gram-negative bacterial TonB protein C-terminal